MPSFQIHRLRAEKRQQFRWAPHSSGTTTVKPKDYEQDAESVEAPTVYAAWNAMRASSRPLAVGDILESEDAALRIYKFTGFEEARWFIPEPNQAPPAAASGEPPATVVQ